MSIQSSLLTRLVVAGLALALAGCVMQRTIKDGDSVVARGYVLKAPVLGP